MYQSSHDEEYQVCEACVGALSINADDAGNAHHQPFIPLFTTMCHTHNEKEEMQLSILGTQVALHQSLMEEGWDIDPPESQEEHARRVSDSGLRDMQKKAYRLPPITNPGAEALKPPDTTPAPPETHDDDDSSTSDRKSRFTQFCVVS